MSPVTTEFKEETSPSSAGPNIPLSPQEERVIKLFSGATLADWEDWRWQIRNRIRTLDQISKLMKLTPHEERGVKGAGDKLTMSIPPYFAALIDAEDPGCPIRLQSVPLDYEFETTKDEMLDPDRKSTRLNSSHLVISYAVFCLKKNNKHTAQYSCHKHVQRHAARWACGCAY